MQYKPEPPTPYASVARGQAPGLFSPPAGSSRSSNVFGSDVALGQAPDPFAKAAGGLANSASSAHRSGVSSQGPFDGITAPMTMKPVNYTRVETTFLIEEAKAQLLALYQQEESLGVHLEAKRHSLLHLKSEIARTDQLIRELERKRVFDVEQDANDRSLSHRDMEEVEKLSQDILKEERILSQLRTLLEETQVRKAAFQEQLDRDMADRADIKAALAKFSGKSPAAPAVP